MSRFLRQARTLVSVYYAYMLEYRAEIVFWALSGLLPLILMGVWMKASAAGHVPGTTPADFARYFMAVFILGQFTTVWVIWEFEFDIIEGRLSPYLLHPMDPVWRHVAMHLGERLTRFPLVVAMVVIFFLLYPQALWLPSPRAVVLAIAAAGLALVLRFTMQYTFAMGSFWVERSSSIEQLTFILYIFLSGRIAPMELYPQAVRDVALLTPFPYVVYFPVKMLLEEGASPWRGFAITLGWIGIFVVLNRLLWRRGLKRYSGMGA